MLTGKTERIHRLLRQMRQRYEHPLEVEAYAAQVADGLTPEEDALISWLCPHSTKILDLGCGAGREAIALVQRGHRVVAVDISRAMLRAAHRRTEELGLSIAYVWMPDPLRIPVPNAAFQLVLALAQLLSHISGREARVALLAEVHRVLAAQGRFVAAVTDRSANKDLYGEEAETLSDLERAAGWEEGDLWVWQPSAAKLDTPLFFHLHTEEELREEMKAAGLRLLEYIPGDSLAAGAGPDAGRYRFAVAEKVG
jgi:SAM-dependent methyltransferase